jgi:two-component system sensor histidine kinase HydH
MQARLAHQEKIAELGRVAAQVAHEVRNPLTGLQLYAMHMKTKLADRMSEAELELADKIVETIGHLAQTVEQIVNFARPMSLERREVDLNRVVTDLLQLLEPQLNHGRVVTSVELSPGRLSARLDESSVRSALTNLIVNAVQAMTDGGRLSVKTLREGDRLRVEIADTGVGMSREQVAKMFEAFYTTKAKGLGLGMPYAKKVIEEHGGEIGVESSPGAGTLVTVRLPVDAEGA